MVVETMLLSDSSKAKKPVSQWLKKLIENGKWTYIFFNYYCSTLLKHFKWSNQILKYEQRQVVKIFCFVKMIFQDIKINKNLHFMKNFGDTSSNKNCFFAELNFRA